MRSQGTAVLDLLQTGRLSFAGLVTHQFPISRAVDAYAVLSSGQPCLGVQLTYDPTGVSPRGVTSTPQPRTSSGELGIGLRAADERAFW